MNWLLITVGVIFLICIVVGISRGAIKIMVSLATTLVTFVLVFFLTPYVADAIAKFTPLDDMVKSQVVSTMANAAVDQVAGAEGGMSAEGVRKALNAAGVSEELLAQYGISGSILDGIDAGQQQSIEDVIEGADIPRDMQIAAIQNADLPEVFKNLLSVNNNSEVYQQLGVETFAQYVGRYLAKLIVNIAAFLCTFVLITIVLRAIVFALDIVSALPGVGFINRLAGGVMGIVGALIIVWTLYVIITLLYTTSIGKEMFRMIQSDKILSILYEYNPIMKLATIFR